MLPVKIECLTFKYQAVMNYGKKIEKVVVTDGNGIENVLDIIFSGEVFRVDYSKKDGSLTTMTCRTGVKKHLSGSGKSKTDLVDKRQIAVWSFDRGWYRVLNMDKILVLKHGGILYDFRNAFATRALKKGLVDRAFAIAKKPGEYIRVNQIGRTIPAQNGYVLK
jgi:hypothetical protein